MYQVFDYRTNEVIFQSDSEKKAHEWAVDFAIKRVKEDIANSGDECDGYDPEQEADYELFEGAEIEIIEE